MKELLEALLDLHTMTLMRQKILINLLEKREIVTRAEVDAAFQQLPQNEADEDTKKVRETFASCLNDRLGWKLKT